MEKLPHYIKQWRKYRGLSQERLGLRIDKTQGYISKLEKFKQEYNQPALEALANALSCSPADLIMRDPTKEAAIWDIWDQIPETKRSQAVAVLQTFIENRKTG